MKQTLLPIARITLLECRQTRVAWVAIAIALLGVAGAEFVGTLALTDGDGMSTALLGAFLRWSGVALVALFVIASGRRELDDKVHELLLAIHLPRAAWFLGKLLGYTAATLVIALLYAGAVVPYTALGAAAQWGLSLWCELTLIAALALLTLYTFEHTVSAFGAVVSFYLLSRAMGAIHALAHGPFVETTVAQRVMVATLDAIAFVLPDLDRFTASDWLVNGPADGSLPWVVAQTAVYLPFLVGCALFDLYRKEF